MLNRSKNPLEGISPEYSDYLKNWLYEILYNDALICQNPILPQTISYQEIIHGDYSVYKQALANRESEVDADDALIILHTSGTAGQPQGSLPIHHNVISMSLVQKDEFHLADDMQAGEYAFDLVSGESFHSAATQYGAVLTIAVWALVLKGFVDPIKNIIKIFCTSPYIHQHNYVEVLNELIDIFYFCKNEIEELMSDQELISQMKEYFDKSCGGSLELLKNRELMILIRDIREQSLVEHNEEKERKCWDGPKIY